MFTRKIIHHTEVAAAARPPKYITKSGEYYRRDEMSHYIGEVSRIESSIDLYLL